MREAGFSSTAVKNNIEEYTNNTIITTTTTTHQTTTPLFFFPGSASASASPSPSPSPNNTSKFVFEVFLGMRKRRNVVLVGDYSTEGIVLEVMRKFKMGEVPEEMKGVKFVEFVPSMADNNKSNRVYEFLRRKLGENYGSGNLGGVVVYVGDLKWIVERGSSSNYEVDGLVGEIERLLVEGFHNNNNNNHNNKKIKIWVMGVASYQIYMRCQMRLPSLETQWDLHALPLPSSGPALTLHSSRYQIPSLLTRLNYKFVPLDV